VANIVDRADLIGQIIRLLHVRLQRITVLFVMLEAQFEAAHMQAIGRNTGP
jgi:hypothetical protein